MTVVLAPLVGTGAGDDPFRVDGARQIIDLRPDARVVDGWAFAMLEIGAAAPAGSLVLTDADDGSAAGPVRLSGNIRNQLSNRLGLTVPNTALSGIVAEILLSGDDRPLGSRTRWAPLRPSRRRKRMEIWLGGLLWQQPVIAGGATLTETWAGVSDGTDINGDHPWTKVTEGSGAGAWNINSERLSVGGSENYNSARAEADLDGTDHSVTASLLFDHASGPAMNQGGVCARFASAANTFYTCQASPRNGLAPWLQRVVAGSITTLASTANTVPNPATYTVSIEVDGSSITGSVSGFSDLNTTDTDLTTGTRWGAFCRGRSVGNQHRWDNFTAEDLSGGVEVQAAPAVVTAAAQSGSLDLGAHSVSASPVTVQTQAQAADVSVGAGVTIAAQPIVVAAGAQAANPVVQSPAADVYEDWSGYPDSTMGNPTALDGARRWRQGANQTVDLSKAGWRIRDGVAYAGAGFTTAAGIPTDSVAATSSSISSARCETDLGTTDMYVRATFGTLNGAPAGTGFGVLARVGEADSLTCYYLQIRQANNEVKIQKIVGGTFTGQVGSTAAHIYAANDVFELRCFGTTISVRVNDVEVISATDSDITTGSKAGLFANTVASNSGVRCTAWQAGPLDGSGDPVEDPPEDPLPMVLWATQVMAGTTTARISCQARNAALVRLVVADNAGLTTPVFTSSYQAPDSLELTSFEATGLTAGTDYFYGLQVDDVTIDGVRELRTAPSGQTSFTVAMGGDAGDINTTHGYPLSIKTSNSPAYDRIADRDPAFFLFAGDRHYRDYNLASLPAHLLALRDTFNNPRLAGLAEQLPVMQIWDDHDYTGVSDGSATGRDAAVELFRTAIPTDAWLVDTAITDPVGYTFAWGRTRWIILDHRSSRTAGNILGTAQLNAVLDQIENATEELIFLYVGVPWIATAAPLADHWGAFTSNRATIAEKIEDFAKGRVVLLHADQHLLAIDDGTNTQYDTGTTDPGPPLLDAAPLDSGTSFKTGDYSEGFVPDPPGSVEQQYATIEVDDQGSQLVVTMRGWQLDGAGTGETEVITHQFVVPVTGAGVTVQAQPVTVAADTQAAALDLGALTVAASPVTVQTQPQAAVPVGSGVVVQAAPAVISAAAQSGSLDLSALVVTASPATVQAQAQAASVGGGVFVAAQPVTVAAGGQTAALDLGALSVQGDPVTVAAEPQAAALDLGALALQAQPVDVAVAAQAANVNSGSVLISAQPAIVAAAAQAADLLTAVVVQASPVLVGADPQAATILGGAVTVSAQPVILTAAAQEADPVRAATLIQAQPVFVQAAAQVALVEAVVVIEAQPVVVTVEAQPPELAVVVVIKAEPISLAVVASAAVVLSGPQPVGRTLQPLADLRALQPVGNLRALQPLG
jgi:hypothetical protein